MLLAISLYEGKIRVFGGFIVYHRLGGVIDTYYVVSAPQSKPHHTSSNAPVAPSHYNLHRKLRRSSN